MAAEEFIIPFTVDYGGIELKRESHKFTLWSLAIATAIQWIGVGTYWSTVWLAEEDNLIIPLVRIPYSELEPPPSFLNQTLPQGAISSSAKPIFRNPVPVPDAQVNPAEKFAIQQELSHPMNQAGEGTTDFAEIVNPVEVDEEPPPFRVVEKEPVIVKSVEPKYPEIALRAGLEGTVYIKMWVDKQGKVRKVIVLKSDAEIFNQNAIDAAMQWKYAPALMQQGPVSVWVAVPFKFRLLNK
ncbi:MAG: energy transducer TonB [Ignavibacteriales bacterium]|nr:energy transducer TonB [Ignavibacteriales bacterium]